MRKKTRLGGAWDGARLVLSDGAGDSLAAPCAAPDDTAGLARAVQARGWAGREIVAALPASAVLHKTLRLPSTDPAELRDMAVLEACRRMPFSPEDIVVQAEGRETDAEGYTLARVSIARREDARRHAGLYERLGLRAARLVPTPQAVAALMPGDGWLLSVSAGDITLVRVEGRALRLARAVPLGATALYDAAARERVLGDFAAAVKDAAVPPGTLVLAGPADAWPALRALAESLFPGVPVDAAEREDWPARGCAALPPGDDFGLLPPEERSALERARARRRNGTTAALAAGCVIMAGLGLGRAYAHKRAMIRALDAQSIASRAEVEELRRLERLMDLREGRAIGRGALPDVLARLNSAMPSSVTLLGLSYERGRVVQLQGLAPTLSQAVAAVDALAAARVFERVEMVSSNARSIQGREKIEFQMEGRWGREGRAP